MKDWNIDSKGKNMLDQEDMFESLFELVDIWVPDVDEDNYILFFDTLRKKLSLG